MSNIDKFVKMMISQLGVTETGTNITKFSKFFDTPKKDGGAWQFFNTKKQGAEWCAIFLLYCFYILFGEEATRKAFNLPAPKNNCAAGVPYLYEYMKKAGLLIKEPRPGCIVFFNTTKKCSHVGGCEYVDGKLHTIEGNKSNKVKRCTYTLNSSKIYAYAMPIFPDGGDTYMVEVRTLKYIKGNTMKGEDVKSVQAIIGAKQDGSYGPESEKCAKAWQKAHGLVDDGSWGPKSWNAAIGAK